MSIPRAVFTTSSLIFLAFSSCTSFLRKSEREYDRRSVLKSREIHLKTVKEIFRTEPYIKVGLGEYDVISLEGKGRCVLLSSNEVISKDAPNKLRVSLKSGKKGKVLHWIGVGVFQNRLDAELLRQNDTSLIVKKLGIYPRYYVLKGPFDSFDEAMKFKYPNKKAVYSILEVSPKGEIWVEPLRAALESPVVYRCDTVVVSLGKTKRKYLGEMWVMPSMDAKRLLLINRLKLEDYLKGVIPWEMSPSYPVEALKAQAIAARTHALDVAGTKWALLSEPYDITNDFTTQVYKGLSPYPIIDSVVNSTRGIVMMDGNRFSIATFFTSCGGSLEDGESWGDTLIKSKADDIGGVLREFDLKELGKSRDPTLACSPHDDLSKILKYGTESFRWSRRISLEEISENVKKHLGVNLGRVKGVSVLKRTKSGRVKVLLVKGSRRSVQVVGDWDIRQVLGIKSSLITLRKKGNYVYIRGGGWGHGVGMCQVGAGVRAHRGWRYESILLFYYGNVDLVKLW